MTGEPASPTGPVTMPGETVQWQLSGGVAHLALCRIRKRNALRMADWQDFADALDQIVAAGARAIVVHSQDPAVFSAGSDLSELAGLAGDAALRVPFAQVMDAVMVRLSSGPAVTIAAIEGSCHGAGVAIAMACNVRVAGPVATFGIPPARFGISYPAGDIARLAALVGPGQAARLLYCTEMIDSAEAARIGLVEIAAEVPLDKARDLAARAAGNSPASIALLKGALAVPGPDAAQDAQFIDGFATEDFRNFVKR